MGGPSTSDGARTGGVLSLNVVDQAVSGATNVLIAVIAARALGPEEFGVFGIVYLVYILSLTALRALVSEPALINRAERVPGAPIASTFLLGGVLATLMAVAGLAIGGAVRVPLLVLGALFTGLAIQDVGRYLAFAVGRPAEALRIDLLWLVLQLAGLGFIDRAGGAGTTSLIFAWGGAGAGAGALVLWTHRAHLDRPSLVWVRRTWDFSWRYLISYCTTFGLAYAVTLGLGAVAGARAVGSVRGAQLLFSPLTMIITAAINTLAVQIFRTGTSGPVLWKRMARVSFCLSALAIGMMMVVLALPDSLGRVALGDSWAGAGTLLLPAGIQALSLCVCSGARIGLTGSRAVRDTLTLDLRMAPVLLVVPMAGAVFADARGFLWALAMTNGAIAAVWWYRFRHVSRRGTTTTSGPDGVRG